MRDDAVYLRHILESIQLVEVRTASGFSAFVADPLLQDAVLRRLETLADAASRISERLRAQHPEIPWRDIADFRNRVAHGYLDVDLTIVWRIIELDLPMLRSVAEEELGRMSGS